MTALGTGIIALLTLVAHLISNFSTQMSDIGKTLSAIDKRNALEDERHSNLAHDVQDIQGRLDRKGILA